MTIMSAVPIREPVSQAQVNGLVEEGVTLKLIHHAARLQGNGTTLSGIVTSRR